MILAETTTFDIGPGLAAVGASLLALIPALVASILTYLVGKRAHDKSTAKSAEIQEAVNGNLEVVKQELADAKEKIIELPHSLGKP